MKKKAMVLMLWTTLCLLMMLTAADAETRQGVIALEGMEETIEETRFESPQGFSFWYASEGLKAYQGEAGGMDGAVVASAYTDDYMVLSVITEEEAGQYAKELGIDIRVPRPSDPINERYDIAEGSSISRAEVYIYLKRFIDIAKDIKERNITFEA